jgi:hypothetical protein
VTSTREEYRRRVLYRHPSSATARAPDAKPTANHMANARSDIQQEKSQFAEKARTERRELDNKQKIRRSRAPHASFDQQEQQEKDALDKSLAEKKKSLDARHDGRLEAVMQKHMPK